MQWKTSLGAVVVTTSFFLSACSGGGGNKAQNPPPPPPTGLTTGPATCAGGTAGDFACSGVSLRQRVPHSAMGGTNGNDIWGWADPANGNEYALVGMTNGTAFVDVSDPENPVYLGRLPTATTASAWRDIKVHMNHAYIVADGAGGHGMQFFDLTRLRGVMAPQTFNADDTYTDFGNAHNLAINEDTGFAYAVGTNTCGGGLHMIDITTPNNPMFAGCHAFFDTHDTQCVSYVGPDVDHAGAEVCFNSAEDRIEIADVTNRGSTSSLATATYPELGFVHQAWLTEDHRFLLVGDEFDESNFDTPTRTHVLDVSDLDSPTFVFTYEASTSSIDHNLYVVGNRVYQANYTTGLRVLEFGDLGAGDMTEIAFFDTFPGNNARDFAGAWSVYPFLPSGNVIVNDITNGLFVLTLQ